MIYHDISMVYRWDMVRYPKKNMNYFDLSTKTIVTLDLRQLHLVISDAVFVEKNGEKTTRHRLAVELLGAHLHDLLAKQGTSTTLQTQVGLVLDNYPLIYNHNL